MLDIYKNCLYNRLDYKPRNRSVQSKYSISDAVLDIVQRQKQWKSAKDLQGVFFFNQVSKIMSFCTQPQIFARFQKQSTVCSLSYDIK